MNSSKTNRLLKIVLTVVAIQAILLMYPLLNKPFIGHHDWNGVQYGNMARNFVRYGYLTTKFGQVENAGIVDPSAFAFNTHHPATFPLLESLSFRLFGIGEWQARLIPLLASLTSAILIAIIAWKLTQSLSVAYLAGTFLAVTPMFRYFAAMPVHEPLILAFVLLAVERYLAWSKGDAPYWHLFAANFAAQLIGWPGFYLAPLLFIGDLIIHRRLKCSIFIPLHLTAVLVFVLQLLHNQIITGSIFGGGLLEILLFRLNLVEGSKAQVYGFSFIDFLKKEVQWFQVYFTRLQLGLLVMFAILATLKRQLGRYALVILLLVYGITHALIFRNAAYLHEYMVFYVGPGIALAAALGFNYLKKELKPSSVFTFLLVLMLAATAFLERNRFYEALYATKMHQIGKLVGEEIALVTNPTDTIAIHPIHFAVDYSKFAAFYGDRNLSYFNYGESTPSAMYEAIIKTSLPEKFPKEQYIEMPNIYIRKLR